MVFQKAFFRPVRVRQLAATTSEERTMMAAFGAERRKREETFRAQIVQILEEEQSMIEDAQSLINIEWFI